MVVKTQCTGSGVTGLLVGAKDVRRYFPRGLGEIELELDSLHIQCWLGPEFWEGRPEIHDPRLCEWLDFKMYRGQKRKSILLALTPSGRCTFQLRALSAMDRQALLEGAGTLI